MPAFAGSSLEVGWIQAAATTILTGDHKSCSYTPSLGLYDQTAGADTNKSYLPGVKDGTMTFNAVIQSGSGAGGTLTFTTLAEGNSGTVKIFPEGTVAGKTQLTIPAIAQGAALSFPYDNVCEVTCNWQQNGARVEGTSNGTV